MAKAVPGFKISSRWKLSNTLITSEYKNVKEEMIGIIKQQMGHQQSSDSVCICLTTDGLIAFQNQEPSQNGARSANGFPVYESSSHFEIGTAGLKFF
jgi:hypothetical protein